MELIARRTLTGFEWAAVGRDWVAKCFATDHATLYAEGGRSWLEVTSPWRIEPVATRLSKWVRDGWHLLPLFLEDRMQANPALTIIVPHRLSMLKGEDAACMYSRDKLTKSKTATVHDAVGIALVCPHSLRPVTCWVEGYQ